MSFVQIQGVIFFSIIFCSLIGGKKAWSYVNILDTKSQTFLCCTSS